VDGIDPPHRVGPVGRDVWGPMWSIRNELAFVVDEVTDVVYPRRGVVWVVYADGSRGRALEGTETSDAPSWSPDGRTLAYADGGIKLISADGKHVRALTASRPGHDDRWPRWSASGRSILFARQAVDGHEPASLRTVDVRTRRTRAVATTYLTSPTYSWAPR
jgi:Tol biopolymer transport system component